MRGLSALLAVNLFFCSLDTLSAVGDVKDGGDCPQMR